jgi:ABC-type glycerol-3-phosphate transport system substrate-binding protein
MNERITGRWRLAGAAVAVIATVAACSSSGSNSGKGSTSTGATAPGTSSAAAQSPSGGGGSSAPAKLDGGGATFVVYGAEAPSHDADLKMLQSSFGDPNNLKIKLVSYTAGDFLTQFQNAVRSNTEVDGLLLNGQNVNFLQSKGLLAPIDGLVDTSAIEAAAIDPFKIDGKLYAAGIGTLNTSMMAVNEDLVAKYGLTVPKTFDDIKADVAKLKGTGVSLFGFGGATTFQWPMWFMQMFQQTTNDQPIETTQKTLSGGQPDFTSAPYVQAMQKLKDLGASGAFEPGLIGTANTAAQADFLAGKSVLYWYGSWIISQFVQQAKFKIDIAPFPSFVDGVTPRPTGAVTEAVAVYSRVPADKKPFADAFVKYLTSTEGDAQVMAAAPQGFELPATKGTPVEGQTALGQKVVTDYVPKTFTFLDWLWPAAVTTAFQQNIQAVVGQQKSPEAAMQDIQKAFETAKAQG